MSGLEEATTADVRFGPIADIYGATRDVRFSRPLFGSSCQNTKVLATIRPAPVKAIMSKSESLESFFQRSEGDREEHRGERHPCLECHAPHSDVFSPNLLKVAHREVLRAASVGRAQIFPLPA